MIIRDARSDDAAEIAAIYAPYVERSAVSFELDTPSGEEMRRRIEQTQKRYPFLVAEENGRIVGYAYLGEFHARAAYAHSAETSLYVKEGMTNRGVGKAIYAALEEKARDAGIRNLYACVSYTEAVDEHLNRRSIDFHLRRGYRLVGIFRECGLKFGKLYDMAYLEKIISSGFGMEKEKS